MSPRECWAWLSGAIMSLTVNNLTSYLFYSILKVLTVDVTTTCENPLLTQLRLFWDDAFVQ